MLIEGKLYDIKVLNNILQNLKDEEGHFSARFQSMTGDGTMLRFQAEDADGICQAEGRTDFQENEKIYLSVDAEKIYLFDKDTEKTFCKGMIFQQSGAGCGAGLFFCGKTQNFSFLFCDFALK